MPAYLYEDDEWGVSIIEFPPGRTWNDHKGMTFMMAEDQCHVTFEDGQVFKIDFQDSEHFGPQPRPGFRVVLLGEPDRKTGTTVIYKSARTLKAEADHRRRQWDEEARARKAELKAAAKASAEERKAAAAERKVKASEKRPSNQFHSKPVDGVPFDAVTVQ
jgi:hypothetical protein